MIRTLSAVSIVIISSVSIAQGAPEDRGPRGPLVAVSAGSVLGTAWDDEGREAGAHLGYAVALRLGEEVLPDFSLGLEFLAGSAQGNHDKYSMTFGGLLIHASWRPFNGADGLLFLVGTGVGGGGLSEMDDSGFSGSIFGALHMIGTQYDFFFGDRAGKSWTISPSVRLWAVPASGSLESQLVTTLIGVEITRYSGRVVKDFKDD
ncbi:MAG: hypothetical protein VX589_06280 [Myxococcota bacterium]|nr:hypothetical protein [Myxococcota bacterium]